MKKNLMPDMRRVKMVNRDGEAFVMWLELRKGGGTNYVFLTDTNDLGDSRLARDAVYLLDKICRQLSLRGDDTVFYRHIYREQVGSIFGHFEVDWHNPEGARYKFQMLTNLEDLHHIRRVLDTTEVVPLEAQVSHRKVANG